MAESVKVVVRCRPMNEREKNLKCSVVVSMNSNAGQCSIKNPSDPKSEPKRFTFDGAYYTESTTEQIYNEIGFPLVEGVTEGYNGTIFAYGQTGCGKSFSMQGISDPPTQRGIIPRAFDHIFETISVSTGAKYLVNAAYCEIYLEDLRDLLGKDIKRKLELHESPDRGVFVEGLSWHPVHNVQDCERIMEKGWKNRATGATLMNKDSSRSHSIFTIYLERADEDGAGEEHIRAGKLNLVDLAGSERQAKTGSTGARLKEATKINLSLSALGNVISALVDGKSSHIPYRDSKLTRMLQDSLGGNTKTLMVACLSPADNNYDETLSTLRYANRAKNIKNKPKINEDPKDALLREYKEEIEKLKAMLSGQLPLDAAAQPTFDVEAERQKIKAEFESQLEEMRANLETEKGDKYKIQADMDKLQAFYQSKLESLDNKDVTKKFSAAVAIEEAEANVIAASGGQHSVTVNDVTSVEQTHPKPGDVAPQDMTKEALLIKLQALQQQMVGGEQANNEELKNKRKKRRKIADDTKQRLADAAARMEDEGIVLNIYESIEEQLKQKTTLLDKEVRQNRSLRQEINDIQSEFESDRREYLDTIRKTEEENMLFQAILEKVQPLLRRDCNYANLDKIKSQAVWDDELQSWRLPGVEIERTTLPAAGGLGSRKGQRNSPQIPSSFQDEDEEDRYLRKLHQRGDNDISKSYFKPKRQDQLLNARHTVADPLRTSPHGFGLSPSNTSINSNDHLVGLDSFSAESFGKPTRLEPLALTGRRRK